MSDFGILNQDDGISTSSKRSRTALTNEGSIFPVHERSNTIVVSIVENRSREICISKIETSNRSTLQIYLINDNHSYAETISIIQDILPDEVLLHDAYRTKVLYQKLTEASKVTNQFSILFISRQYFDQDKGANLLKKILIGQHAIDADLISKYIVLAGTYCLLRYIENCDGYHYGNNTLRLEYMNHIVNHKLHIDRHSTIHLELIHNNHNYQSNQKLSLYGTINYTNTIIGSRYLKANILKPSADYNTIQCRLQTVDILLQYRSIVNTCNSILKKYPDFDKMLNGLIIVPKQVTKAAVKQSIDTLIYLKQILSLNPILSNTLSTLLPSTSNNNTTNTTSTTTAPNMDMNQTHTQTADDPYVLLHTIIENITHPHLITLHTSLQELITDSTEYMKSSHMMRYQECFMIKPHMHSLLDISRKVFLQCVEDIYTLNENYNTTFQYHSKVMYNTTRGYYLSIPIPSTSSQYQYPPTSRTSSSSTRHPRSTYSIEENKNNFNNINEEEINPNNRNGMMIDIDNIPSVFIQVVLQKRSLSCTTTEIIALNHRAQEAMTESLTITYELLQSFLLSHIRQDSGLECVYRLTDSIALLDMLLSFATMIIQSSHIYTRPHITTTQYAPLVIKQGYHMILRDLNPQHTTTSIVPNDSYMDATSSFQIITGPNNSGKTIYMKQIALIVILAHIGCYIPAAYGSIPLCDHIYTRLGTQDDIENNLSTFMIEMKDMSRILHGLSNSSYSNNNDTNNNNNSNSNNTTHNSSYSNSSNSNSNSGKMSLVLLDELGRGTSTIDGLSLAMAIAESIITMNNNTTNNTTNNTKSTTPSNSLTSAYSSNSSPSSSTTTTTTATTFCYCYFITHYTQMTSLAMMYPCVKNIHLKIAYNLYDTNNTTSSTTALPTTVAGAGAGAVTNITNNNNTNNMIIPITPTTTATTTNTTITSSHTLPSSSSSSASSSSCVQFTHQVCSGISEIQGGYGLLIADICGFPKYLIHDAREIQNHLRTLYPLFIYTNPFEECMIPIQSIVHQLSLLNHSSIQDIQTMTHYIQQIKQQISPSILYKIHTYLDEYQTNISIQRNTTITTTTNNSTNNMYNNNSNEDISPIMMTTTIKDVNQMITLLKSISH